jgi:hypothetical protein
MSATSSQDSATSFQDLMMKNVESSMEYNKENLMKYITQGDLAFKNNSTNYTQSTRKILSQKITDMKDTMTKLAEAKNRLSILKEAYSQQEGDADSPIGGRKSRRRKYIKRKKTNRRR